MHAAPAPPDRGHQAGAQHRPAAVRRAVDIRFTAETRRRGEEQEVGNTFTAVAEADGWTGISAGLKPCSTRALDTAVVRFSSRWMQHSIMDTALDDLDIARFLLEILKWKSFSKKMFPSWVTAARS